MGREIRIRWCGWRCSKSFFISLLLCTMLLVVQVQFIASAQDTSAQYGAAQDTTTQDMPSPPPQAQLPEPQVHPLPASLAQWQDVQHQGDYFSAIEPTPVGYLIWSEFPVKVFVEPATSATGAAGSGTGNAVRNGAEFDRAQGWVDAVTEAIQEWQQYLPLQQVEFSEAADIAIWRSAPPMQLVARSDTADSNVTSSNRLNLPRIRSAETKYHLFIDRPVVDRPAVAHSVDHLTINHSAVDRSTVDRPDAAPAQLRQRFTIQLTPHQTRDYIQATARHELGHALGIWGHSPVETDALYFSQVRNAPPISDRDINTLKQIYQQPTRIGWEIVSVHGADPGSDP